MKFSHSIFYVKDVVRSLAFYEKAFRLKIKFLHEEGIYGEMETGKTSLAFASNDLARAAIPGGILENNPVTKPQGVEIAFETDNVDEAFAHAVKSGATPLTDPADMPWGQRLCRVRDCDGIMVEICSPMK